METKQNPPSTPLDPEVAALVFAVALDKGSRMRSKTQDILVRVIPFSEVILGLFTDNWKRISMDPWVLETIQGFKLELYESPIQSGPPRQMYFYQTEQSFMDSEIQTLLDKGAISL